MWNLKRGKSEKIGNQKTLENIKGGKQNTKFKLKKVGIWREKSRKSENKGIQR